MDQVKNKVDWCLRKAQKELKSGSKHRGLIIVKPDIDKSREFIKKAEHYLNATEYLDRGNYSDISASTVFYSMYHSLLAIAIKFGFESRNQECTFALIANLIDEGKIDLDRSLLDKIASFDTSNEDDETSLGIREKYQYGTSMTLNDDIYEELFNLGKEVISKTKEIIEE
jgi:uncharacterized protein (UPF0332 family)